MEVKGPIWPDQLFSMGDKLKILFSTTAFSYPGNSKKYFQGQSGLMGLEVHFDRILRSKCDFHTFFFKNSNFLKQ